MAVSLLFLFLICYPPRTAWSKPNTAPKASREITRELDVTKFRDATHRWLGKTIQTISIRTPFSFDHQTIQRMLDIKKGQIATRQLLISNIKRLNKSGFFDKITVLGKEHSGGPGIDVTFICRKSFLVDKITVKGGYTTLPWLGPTAISKKDVMKVIRLSVGAAFKQALLNKSIEGIKKLFKEDGFWNCEVHTTVQTDEKHRTVKVQFTIKRGKPAKIRKFDIKGTEVGLDDVYNIFKLYRFNKWKLYRFREEKFKAELKKIEKYYKKFGYFSAHASIKKIEYNPKDASIIMHLVVEPGPLTLLTLDYTPHLWNFYWNIPWLRNVPFLNSWLQFTPSRLLPVMQGGVISKRKIEKGSENLTAVYKKHGYEKVNISYRTSKLKKKKGLRLRYIIDDGNVVKVSDIQIQGNYHFSDDQIRAVMRIKMKRRNPVTQLIRTIRRDLNGIFVTEEFARDILAIRNMYLSAGFRKCQVKGTSHFINPNQVSLRISIDEGIKTTISAVRFEGNTHCSTSELYNAVNLAPGQPYREKDIQESITRLLLFYESKGFLSSSLVDSLDITPRIQFHDYGAKAKVIFSIQERYQIWFDKPLVTGVIHTKYKVIQREFQFKKFTPYSLEKVLQTRERLYKLGIFQRVSFDELKIKHPYFSKTIVFNFQEKDSGSVDLGGGFNSLEGWHILTSISDRNFLNRGQYLGLTTRTNEKATRSRIELLFREPYFSNLPIKLDLKMYREFEEVNSFNTWLTGGAVSFSRVFHTSIRTGFEYRLDNFFGGQQHLVFDDRDDVLAFRDFLDRFPRRISSLTPKVSWDTRNNPFLPARGFISNVQLEIAQDFLGSQENFLKFTLQQTNYLPLTSQTILVANTSVGISKDLPIYERFRLGGPSTLRGYELDSVGPTDAQGYAIFGNTMVLGNLELRVPLAWGLAGQLFYDVGNLWLEPIEEINDFSVVSSVGFGLRMDFSFGPMRLDFGYPFDGRVKGSPLISFTIGHPF